MLDRQREMQAGRSIKVANKINYADKARGPMDPSDRLRNCFIQTFGLEANAYVDDLHYQEVAGWDSVGHMQLIAALETTFDIMIDTQDVLDMSSFRMAREILRKYEVGI